MEVVTYCDFCRRCYGGGCGGFQWCLSLPWVYTVVVIVVVLVVVVVVLL